MMYSVTDVSGLNTISRKVLANGAQAMIGMAKARAEARAQAEQNRVSFGRTKARRAEDRAAKARTDAALDGHKREP